MEALWISKANEIFSSNIEKLLLWCIGIVMTSSLLNIWTRVKENYTGVRKKIRPNRRRKVLFLMTICQHTNRKLLWRKFGIEIGEILLLFTWLGSFKLSSLSEVRKKFKRHDESCGKLLPLGALKKHFSLGTWWYGD